MGIMTMRKRKRLMKTAKGTRSKGSETLELAKAMAQVIITNKRKAVAIDSRRAALHI